MTRFPLWIAAVATGALAACQSHAAVSTYAVVDSLPYFDVGPTAPDGSIQLGAVIAAFRLPNGAIVVGDSSERRVRIIDTATDQITTIGRDGEGPGEFRSVDWLGRCRSDSIFVWDPLRGVATAFGPDGTFGREIHFAKPPWKIRCAPDADRLAVLTEPVITDGSPSAKAFFASVMFASYAGDSAGAIKSVKMGENRLLGALTQATMDGNTLYVGTSDSLVVDRYRLDGTPAAPLRIAGAAVAVADSDYERELAVVNRGRDSATQAMLRRVFARAPRPKYLPAYRELALDPTGKLWVELSRPGQPAARWRVTALDGTPLGDVVLPADFRLLQIGKGYLLGALENADGEDHVVMYHYHPTR